MDDKIKKFTIKKVFAAALFCCIMFSLCLTIFPISISYADTVVSENEVVIRTYTLEEAVEQKLGQGNYSYEYISGFSEKNRYVLVEGDNCYLIYDTATRRYTEYSDSCNSPYVDMSDVSEKIYYAPTYYFARQNADVVDLSSASVLSVESVAYLKQAEIDKKAADLQKLKSATTMANTSATTVSNTASPYVVGNPGNNEDIKDVTSAYVPYHYYFENLRTNYPQMPIEMQPEFFEALSMILSYYDTVVDDRVIDDCYESNITYPEIIESSAYGVSPRAKYEYCEYLLELFHKYGYDEYNVNRDTIKYNVLDDVINKEILEPKGLWASTWITQGLEKGGATDAKQNVYHGYPYALAIGDNMGPVVNHYVIVYGFDDYDLLCVHNQVTNEVSRRMVIDMALQYCGGFAIRVDVMNMDPDFHVCSNNYQWTYNGCSGSVCVCGKVECNHGNYSYSALNNMFCSLTCKLCKKENVSVQLHSFKTLNGVKQCVRCGYINHNHTFTYTPYSTSLEKMHTATCTGCGFAQTEQCVGYVTFEGTVCRKCGQLISSGSIILSEDEIEGDILSSITYYITRGAEG